MNLSESDRKREQELDRLWRCFNNTRSKFIKRGLLRRIQKLHNKRSPEVIRQMEIERGLWRG